MEKQIPIPTDNIFKFYALFGLLLFIFGFGAMIYTIRESNELVFRAVVELEAIKQIPKPSGVDLAKGLVLEKRLEIMNSDKRAISAGTTVLIAVAAILVLYGFGKWHNVVQPLQDEIARLQLEKLRHEVKQLKHTTAPHH